MSELLSSDCSNFVFRHRRRLSALLLGVLIMLCSLVCLKSQTVTPLVTPSVISPQESSEKTTESGSALGFDELTTDLLESTEPQLIEGDNPLLAYPDDLPEGFDPMSADGFTPLDEVPLADIPEGLMADLMTDDNMAVNDFPNLLGMPAGGGAFSPRITDGNMSGFSNAPGNFPLSGGLLNTLGEGLNFSTALTGAYDSNPLQGFGVAGDSDGGDFFTTMGVAAAYLSTASTWTYGLNYSGGFTEYLDQKRLSGENHNAGVLLNYQGGPLTAGLSLGMGLSSGANRVQAAVSERINYDYRLFTRYRFSGKTSLATDFSENINKSSSGGSDISSRDLNASALWHYSPITEFGPGIRYTQRSGGSRQERTSIGPTLEVNHQLARKISLNSKVGVDFVSFDNGDTPDPSLFTSIGLNYRASSFWGMSLSLLRDAQASISDPDEFEEVTSLRLGYVRRIRRASWTIGMGLENRSFENPDPSATAQSDVDYLTFDTGLGMPILGDSTMANVFMRYQDQNGDGNKSWDAMQFGFGISRTF